MAIQKPSKQLCSLLPCTGVPGRPPDEVISAQGFEMAPC